MQAEVEGEGRPALLGRADVPGTHRQAVGRAAAPVGCARLHAAPGAACGGQGAAAFRAVLPADGAG